MPRSAAAPTRSSIIWLFIALVLGALLIFWRLSAASLFLDEAFTLSVAGEPIPRLLALVAQSDASSPLFHLMTHAAETALHWPVWDYRWLVAPFGLVTIFATWAIAGRLFGPNAASVAGIVVASSAILLDWDRMYRMYGIFVALSVLSWWLLLVLEESTGTRRRWLAAAYVCCAALMPLFVYLGFVVLGSQAVYALARANLRWPVGIACMAAVVALVPWWWGFQEQLARGGTAVLAREVHWIGVARNLVAQDLTIEWYAQQPLVDWLITIVTLALVGGALWLGRRTALPFWLLPAGLQIAASAVLSKNLVNPRYLLYSVPAFAVCVGAVAAWQWRGRILGIVAALLVVGVNIVGAQNLLLDPLYQRTDWFAVAAVLTRNGQPEDVVVLDQGYTHYAVEQLVGFRDRETFDIESQRAVAASKAWLHARPKRRVWYVENQFYYPDPGREVLAYLTSARPIVAKLLTAQIDRRRHGEHRAFRS